MAKRIARATPEQRFATYVSRQMERTTTSQERLQAYHRIGRRILELIPERAEYGSHTAIRLAEAVGRHEGWITKLRNFAIHYSGGDLRELCELDNISWAHVQRLVSVKSRPKRRRLQERISREKLTLKDVQMLVRGSEEQRLRRGRKVTLPGNWRTALHRMTADWETWTHGWEAFKERIEETPRSKRSNTFCEVVRDAAAFLRRAAREVESLEKEIKKAAKR